MKMLAFASRNSKEIVRDPVSIIFGIGLPVVLLALISFIQKSTGGVVDIFNIEVFTPGIAMFSLSFLAMFASLLLAGDRSRSFLTRLLASPMKPRDYIIGYALPLVPIGIAQSVVCFATALILGLEFSPRIFLAVAALIPSTLMFSGLGLMTGVLLTDRQAGPLSSVVIQVAALSSGMWFDLDMIGGTFKNVCAALPFYHAVELAQAALNGGDFAVHLAWVMGYAVVFFAAAAVLFRRLTK